MLLGDEKLVKFLISAGADVEIKNKAGFTPYDIAKGAGNLILHIWDSRNSLKRFSNFFYRSFGGDAYYKYFKDKYWWINIAFTKINLTLHWENRSRICQVFILEYAKYYAFATLLKYTLYERKNSTSKANWNVFNKTQFNGINKIISEWSCLILVEWLNLKLTKLKCVYIVHITRWQTDKINFFELRAENRFLRVSERFQKKLSLVRRTKFLRQLRRTPN